LGGCRSSW